MESHVVDDRILRSGEPTSVDLREQKCYREGSYRVRFRGLRWDLLGVQ